MSADGINTLARAVLYEGYLLYPYRRTALKNQQRWNFGGLFPPAYCSQQEPSETSSAQTECLLEGTADSTIEITVRFLQQLDSDTTIEREIVTGNLRLDDLLQQAAVLPVCFGKNLPDDFENQQTVLPPHESGVGTRSTASAVNPGSKNSDAVERVPTQLGQGFNAELFSSNAPINPSTISNSPRLKASSDKASERGVSTGPRSSNMEATLNGCVEVTAQHVGDGIFKITIRILNQSPFSGGDRDEALRSAFISVHAILSIQRGRFHSMIDPPEALRELAGKCRNIGMWPVLAGPEGSNDRMLSCAIILYDYPKVASESSGDFFDATEIDEMLTLRVQTLSEPEKEALRGSPEPIRSILERCDELTAEQLCDLHASMRVKDTTGCPYQKGDRVRLRPSGSADIFDLALAEKTATVVSVEQDFDGEFHLCVVVDEDPGKDLGIEGKPGHRFFFRTDEVER